MATEARRLDPNSATAEALAAELDGVGLKRAQAVVDHRTANGRFDRPEDLAKVPGIGAATVARNADRLHVKPRLPRQRPGTVDRLPEPIRERIGELRRSGRTVREILDTLATLGQSVSRGALGRYTRRIDALGRAMQESREIAAALIDRYGAEPEHRTARLSIELLHGVIMRLIVTPDGQPIELAPKEAAAMASAVRSLVSASRMDVERERALRAHCATAAGSAARQAGVTPATEALIRAAIEGTG